MYSFTPERVRCAGEEHLTFQMQAGSEAAPEKGLGEGLVGDTAFEFILKGGVRFECLD